MTESEDVSHVSIEDLERELTAWMHGKLVATVPIIQLTIEHVAAAGNYKLAFQGQKALTDHVRRDFTSYVDAGTALTADLRPRT